MTQVVPKKTLTLQIILVIVSCLKRSLDVHHSQWFSKNILVVISWPTYSLSLMILTTKLRSNMEASRPSLMLMWDSSTLTTIQEVPKEYSILKCSNWLWVLEEMQIIIINKIVLASLLSGQTLKKVQIKQLLKPQMVVRLLIIVQLLIIMERKYAWNFQVAWSLQESLLKIALLETDMIKSF